jgi:hypothetical protein
MEARRLTAKLAAATTMEAHLVAVQAAVPDGCDLTVGQQALYRRHSDEVWGKQCTFAEAVAWLGEVPPPATAPEPPAIAPDPTACEVWLAEPPVLGGWRSLQDAALREIIRRVERLERGTP